MSAEIRTVGDIWRKPMFTVYATNVTGIDGFREFIDDRILFLFTMHTLFHIFTKYSPISKILSLMQFIGNLQ